MLHQFISGGFCTQSFHCKRPLTYSYSVLSNLCPVMDFQAMFALLVCSTEACKICFPCIHRGGRAQCLAVPGSQKTNLRTIPSTSFSIEAPSVPANSAGKSEMPSRFCFGAHHASLGSNSLINGSRRRQQAQRPAKPSRAPPTVVDSTNILLKVVDLDRASCMTPQLRIHFWAE